MKAAISIVATLALTASPLRAGTVTVDLGTLPSAQGWTYLGDPPENNIFSVADGVLTQNSVGIGGSSAYYQLGNVFDGNLPFSLSFRGRLLEGEFGSPEDPLGFAVQLDHTSQGVGVGLTSDGVVVYGPSGATLFMSGSIDTSQFHDYLLSGRPDANAWDLFVDGLPLGSGVTEPGVYPDAIYFGDLTDGRNARGEWTQITLTVVPEPSTIALTLLGGLALYARAKARQFWSERMGRDKGGAREDARATTVRANPKGCARGDPAAAGRHRSHSQP